MIGVCFTVLGVDVDMGDMFNAPCLGAGVRGGGPIGGCCIWTVLV